MARSVFNASTYAVEVKFRIRSNVEKPTCGIIGTCVQRVAIWEEVDGVDIRFVAGERLHSLAGANIPQLSEGVAGTRNKRVLVCGIQADAHDIAQVVGKLHNLSSGLDIPFHTSHVTRRG